MLLGREREQRRLEGLLTQARTGQGGALVIQGVPGIGKSSLLRAAAASGDMRVLEIAGRDSESDLPFAALRELLDPILGELDGLSQPQAAAVRAALALAPAVPGDRFAVSAGSHAMLARTAAERPLLLLIDDADWIDGATRSVLAFVGRRLAGLPIAMLVAQRTGAAPLLPERPDDTLVLGALDGVAATALLLVVAPDLAPATRELVLAAAGGIPLGLRELPSALSPDERSGARPPVLPLRPNDAILDVFERRLERLGEATHLALVVVAAAEPPEVIAITEALRALRVPLPALEQAETDGLITIGPDQVVWTHPLARSAAYHGAPPAQRRRAHRALAGVVPEEVAAWHLAAAAIGRDEAAAAALETAARRASERLAYGPAAAAYERAAGLSTPGEQRGARLRAAGASAAAAGESHRAVRLLDEALLEATDPFLRASIEHQRCAVLLATGSAHDAGRRLVRLAEVIAAERPMSAAVMLADAALAITTADCEDGLRVAQRAAACVPEGAPADVAAPVLAALAWCQDLRGQRADADRSHARVAALQPLIDPTQPSAMTVRVTGANRLMLDDPEGARAMLLGAALQLREAGALSGVPYPLALVVQSALWTGDWAAIAAIVDDTLSLAEETGQLPALGWALTAAARFEAARGAAERARAHLARAEAIAQEHGIPSVAIFAQASWGFLALSANDPAAACAPLERARAMADAAGVREPMMMPFCGDLVEALARTGRSEAALEALAWLQELADGSGRPWAFGLVARCRGLLGLEDIDTAFPRALRSHDTMPFERARTLLLHGRCLRRARRRADARLALRAAFEGFGTLSAATWADQARDELQAAGGATRSHPHADALTDAELRVARAVGSGLSNRQAAAELFLSPRTVESHLEHIFRKLGLESRAQLVRWVVDGHLEAGPTDR